MKFRKRTKSFTELNIMCALMMALVLLVLPSSLGWGYTTGMAVLVGALVALNFITGNEYIILDEKGITCSQGKKLLWSYVWGDIAELKHSRRTRRPCVEIVLKDGVLHPLDGISQAALYFELCSGAK